MDDWGLLAVGQHDGRPLVSVLALFAFDALGADQLAPAGDFLREAKIKIE